MKNVIFVLVCFVFSSRYALAIIPNSLVKLATVKEKNSDDYMFLAQEAAIDTKNASERMLDGENSAGALKILEVAIHLMPHRTDLNQLRKTALDTFLKITQKLEEDSIKNCQLLQERYQFLKNIAPDSLAKLKLERSCASAEKTILAKTDEELLKIEEPKILKSLEEEFRPELVKAFPWDDVLANSFLLLRSLYGEDFQMNCTGFAADKVQCESEKIDNENFKEATDQYCGYVEGLLSVSHGNKPILCSYTKKTIFKTTPELYQIYAKVFDNPAFDDDVPTFVILNLKLKYPDRTEDRQSLASLDNKAFRAGKSVALKFEKGTSLLSISEKEKKDLHDIAVTINYKKTFELYQRHFQASLKSSMPELLKKDPSI